MQRLGDDGARHSAETLKHISCRDLGATGIGTEGTRHFAESLKHNTGLHGTNMGHNYNGDDRARNLAQSLQHNTSLKTLDISVRVAQLYFG